MFFLTTASSVFAYVWLVLILTRFSPNVVEWWEALLTFLFFPVLVVSAYLTDKGCFRRGKQRPPVSDDEQQAAKPDGNAETGFCKRTSRPHPKTNSQLTPGGIVLRMTWKV